MRERPRGVARQPPDFASLHPGYSTADTYRVVTARTASAAAAVRFSTPSLA
jgi:hypothetical protein